MWQILGRDKWKNRAKTGKCSISKALKRDFYNLYLGFFQDSVLFSIWHTTLPVFVGPYANVLLQIIHFLLAAHRAVSSANWDFDFVCGEVLVSH